VRTGAVLTIISGDWQGKSVAKQNIIGKKSQKHSAQKRHTLRYPSHILKPEDLLHFIELPVFTKRWEQLGLDDEEDLSALQIFIMTAPAAAKPIAKTKGLRKLRFAPLRWSKGKSGAARVLYVYFERLGIVLLCLVYGKNEIDNISNGVKQYLNKLIDEIERELRQRYFNM